MHLEIVVVLRGVVGDFAAHENAFCARRIFAPVLSDTPFSISRFRLSALSSITYLGMALRTARNAAADEANTHFARRRLGHRTVNEFRNVLAGEDYVWIVHRFLCKFAIDL